MRALPAGMLLAAGPPFLCLAISHTQIRSVSSTVCNNKFNHELKFQQRSDIHLDVVLLEDSRREQKQLIGGVVLSFWLQHGENKV